MSKTTSQDYQDLCQIFNKSVDRKTAWNIQYIDSDTLKIEFTRIGKQKYTFNYLVRFEPDTVRINSLALNSTNQYHSSGVYVFLTWLNDVLCNKTEAGRKLLNFNSNTLNQFAAKLDKVFISHNNCYQRKDNFAL